MTMQKPTKAPDRFLRLLKKAMENHPDKLSLREVARRADISPAYLSRLLSGERGVPSNDAIAQLELVLKIPDRELFKAAARPDDKALEFFRKEEAGPIMRMLADVPTGQLPAVRKLLGQFVKNKKNTKSK
jgi:transcriptional regulator with XRE-family HTH domain